MTPSRRSRYLIKRWNMFQTSSEGDNPEVQALRQNTRGKRIRFYFLVSCELYRGGRSSVPFHFFKAGTVSGSVQDPLERGLNCRPPTVG